MDERESLLDMLFYSSTNKVLREEQLLNIFGVTDLDEVSTEKLLQFCNKNYFVKEKHIMGAKYDVDEMVNVTGKIVSSTTDETGTTYQVKTIANDKATTLYFKED